MHIGQKVLMKLEAKPVNLVEIKAKLGPPCTECKKKTTPNKVVWRVIAALAPWP